MIFNLTPPESTAVEFIEQTLTDAQKAQARTNIGALSIDDVPSGSGILVYNITTASYSSNKYSMPLTYSRYIYVLHGTLSGSDYGEQTSLGFINKDSSKILTYMPCQIDAARKYYGTVYSEYDKWLLHSRSVYSSYSQENTAGYISGNNLLFGEGNNLISFNFIGTIYLMPF